MTTENIMPVSTQKIVLEQFSQLHSESAEPAQKLNEMFFNMMMKSMFDVAGVANKSSTTAQLHQQLYIDVLSQELSDKFDVGFSELQFELNKRER